MVATVRAYLNADAVHDYQKMMKLSDGNIRLEWQWWEWKLGSCNCPPDTLSIERLRVAQKTSRKATVSVLARFGDSTTISGPMIVLRPHVSWVIHDYRRNGIDFAASIAARDAHATVGNVDVRLIGVDRDPTSEDVWFRITNDGDTPIGLDTFTASSATTKLIPWVYDPTVKNIGANKWMVTNLLWQTKHRLPAGKPLQVRLTFTNLFTGKRIALTLSTLS